MSHRIGALETRLGIKLLHRTPRAMSPTEAGQQLFERIAPMFDSISRETDALGDYKDSLSGQLRINAAENPAYYLIYPKIRDFLCCYPDVSIEILINNQMADTVSEGFDFGVRPINNIAQDMIALSVSAERRMAAVAAPYYLRRHPAPHTPQDLARHHCIVTAFDAFNRMNKWEFLQQGKLVHTAVSAAFTANSMMMAKQAALDALGIAWIPHYAVERELADGSLKEILTDCRITYPPMALYYPQNRHKTRAAQALLDFLKESGEA